MGPSPFRFLYAFSIPSASLAEHNPTAYNNALAAMPRDLVSGCGTCSHCGMAIMNIFVVQNAEGKKYGVGCDCVEKHGGSGLVSKMKLAKQKMEREKREAKAAAKWEADRPAREIRIAEANRIAEEKKQAVKIALAARLAAQHPEVIKFVNENAKPDQWDTYSDNGFLESLAKQIRNNGYLSERQWEFVAKSILGTRRYSEKVGGLSCEIREAAEAAVIAHPIPKSY